MNRVSKKLALVVTVIASAIAFGATQDAGAFTPANALTTIAGGGTTAATQFGDGFNAVLGNQTVAYVSGMAVNPASGDLYYSQGGNGNYSNNFFNVRRITGGKIYTVAGSNNSGLQCTANGVAPCINPAGTTATGATLVVPSSLGFNSNGTKLFVMENYTAGTGVIQVVDLAANTLETSVPPALASGATFQYFLSPFTRDASGNTYFVAGYSTPNTNMLIKFDGTTYTEMGSTGGYYNRSGGLLVDSVNNKVYVGSAPTTAISGKEVRRYDLTNMFAAPVVYSGFTETPNSMLMKNGYIYFAGSDLYSGSKKVRRFLPGNTSATVTFEDIAGTGSTSGTAGVTAITTPMEPICILEQSGSLIIASNGPKSRIYSLAPDSTPPVYASSTVASNGLSIAMTYGEALSATTAPASAFSVTANGVTVPIASAAASGTTLTLTLSSAIGAGQTVLVSYTDPSGSDDASAVQDGAGNDAVTITNQSVTNGSTVDLTAPSLISSALDTAGTQLTLTFDEALDSVNVPTSSAFAVSVGGTNRSVTAVAVSGSTAVLTLASAALQGSSITVTYTDPTSGNDTAALQDAAGNDLATFTNQLVTNSSTFTTTTTTTTTTVPASSGSSMSASSATAAPTLVTESNKAQLEATPGEANAIINGKEVVVEIVKAPVDATPAQQLKVAETIIADIAALLPKGTANPVSVVSTSTGPELNGIMVNPDNPKEKLGVPVDSVQLVKAGDTAVLLAALNQTNLPAEKNSGGALEVTRGGIVSATAYGLAASETGEIVLMSTPRLLQTFTVSNTGGFKGQVALPKDIAFGSHTVVMATKSAKVSLGIKLVRTKMQFRIKRVIGTTLFKNRAGVKKSGGKVTLSGSGRCRATNKKVTMAKKPGACYITVRQAAKGSYKAVYYRFTVSVVKKLIKAKAKK